MPARCPACATHLEREPATDPRVSPPEPGFQRSFAPRYDEEGLDSAASASSSLTGARCRALLVDFCNRNVPQARPANRRNPCHALAPLPRPLVALRFREIALGARSTAGFTPPYGAMKPSGHGSEAEVDSGFRLGPQRPSVRLRASRASPQPDCPGHLLSWTRELVGRRANSPVRAHPANTSLARRARPLDVLAHRLEQGRFPLVSAKKQAFHDTRGAFLRRTSPLGRACFSTSCKQPVESRPDAFAISALVLSSTKRGGETKTRP